VKHGQVIVKQITKLQAKTKRSITIVIFSAFSKI